MVAIPPPAGLLHTPPVVASFKIIDAPAHRGVAPVIVAGDKFTVTTAVTVHPLPREYVIVVVPGIMPETTPVPEIVPTVVLLLIHVPPPAVLPNAVAAPAHTCSVPLIAEGAKFTVTTAVVVQP